MRSNISLHPRCYSQEQFARYFPKLSVKRLKFKVSGYVWSDNVCYKIFNMWKIYIIFFTLTVHYSKFVFNKSKVCNICSTKFLSSSHTSTSSNISTSFSYLALLILKQMRFSDSIHFISRCESIFMISAHICIECSNSLKKKRK